ncbi:hypothetical protein [Mycobacteroides saopaulense]|uniref:Uncharacterized protein n=1 Tax=Mycobacteroides saopaulense TaxID=1578165 RepID=A0ABX3C4F0_9MYCO|nr:hypothetical protein [Mycobacteroides saopaulense]OHT88604.1 hypothetical protein BKG68_01475 [Mycobacteroides saopaulense]OHU13423.1 hypothetical protein BKG73_01480 [Mycobacteroides saopaulense]
MLGVLKTVGARAWTVLPQLIAVYLAGRFAHDFIFWSTALAAIGRPYLWAVMLPFGMLSQLAALIGMLLLMRPAIAGVPVEGPASGRGGFRATAGALTGVVLPFIAFYSAWRYLVNDWIGYMGVAFDASAFMVPAPIIQKTYLTLAIAVGVFLIRSVLRRARDRLPSWVIVIEFYLEAAWIYLLIGNWLNDLNVKHWVESRRVIQWAKETGHQFAVHLPFGDTVWDTLGWGIGQAVSAMVVPLGWLTIAGVVYALVPTTNWEDARRELFGGRPGADMLERVSSKSSVAMLAWPFRVQAAAIRDAVYVIFKTGAVPIGSYVLAFNCLGWLFGNASESPAKPGWLAQEISVLIGPHERDWWLGMKDALSVVPDTVSWVLQICLITAVYALFVRGTRSAAAEPELQPS